MSDIVLPIEKSSKEMSLFDYDFKVPYFPEYDECKVPYKATPMLLPMICTLQKIKKSY